MAIGRDVSHRNAWWVSPVIGAVVVFAAWTLAKQGVDRLPVQAEVEFPEQDREFLRAEFPAYVLPLERLRLGKLLTAAIKTGDETEVVRLLDAGADADWSGPQYVKASHSQAPLFRAIKKGNPRIVAALLKHGAKVGGPGWEDLSGSHNEFGQTPLYFAVRCNKRRIVDVLLDHDAMIAGRNWSGKTALVGAVEAANLDLFNQLIRKGAVCDFDSPYYADRENEEGFFATKADESGRLFPESITSSSNLLQLAQRSPNKELASAVEKLFRESPKFSPDRLAEIAVRSDDVASLQKMVANGYDPAKYTAEHDKKTTLLDIAATSNKVKCFELLKQLKIPQTTALAKNTVLRLLAGAGSVKRLQQRLANGARFEAHEPNQSSPLQLAASAGRLEMVDFLLQQPEAKKTWLRSPALLPDVMPLASMGYSGFRSDAKFRTICRRLLNAGTAIPSAPVDSSNNPLVRAAAGGWIDVYEMLEQQAPDLVDHSEALRIATMCNQTDMCRYLLSKEADPNISDQSIKYAFHHRNEDLLKLFLKAEGKLTYPKQFDVSRGYSNAHDYGHPLYNAALHGDTEFCRQVIQPSPDSDIWKPIQYEPYEYDNDIEYFDKGNTLLFAPVFRDHADTLRLFLPYTKQHDQNGSPLLDINARNVFGATALHMAVMYGSPKCTQLLIAAGADVTIDGTTDRWGEGNSLLHLATRDPFAPHHHKRSQHRPDVNTIMPMLIAANARMNGTADSVEWINQKNRWEKTPLHVHAEARNEKACQILIAHGADVNAVAQYGTTVLASAIRNDFSFHPIPEKRRTERSRICINLINAGANFSGNAPNVELSYCGLAYHNGLFDFVDELQRRGVSPDLKNEAAEYLCSAIFYNDHDALKRWIDQGADVNSHAVDGNTPLHTAAGVYDVEACQLLISKGADPNALGKDDMPVMFSVFRQFHSHIGTFYQPEMKKSAASILKLLLDSGADPLLEHPKQKKTVLQAFGKMPPALRELIESKVGQPR